MEVQVCELLFAGEPDTNLEFTIDITELLHPDEAVLDSAASTAHDYLEHHPGSLKTGKSVTLVGAWQKKTEVKVGTIDEQALFAFSNGQCHALALALFELTGWPLVLVGNAECCYDEDCTTPEGRRCQCQIAHMAVVDDAGMLWDIHGPRDLVTVVSEFIDIDSFVGYATRDELLDCFGRDTTWRVPNIAAARPFAKALLSMC